VNEADTYVWFNSPFLIEQATYQSFYQGFEAGVISLLKDGVHKVLPNFAA
jgi:hypothetical protein